MIFAAKWIAGFICAALAVTATARADTVILDFEGQGTGQLHSYGGVNFDFLGSDFETYTATQPPYNPSSPPTRAYSATPTQTFAFETPDRIFDGAYFAGQPNFSVQFALFNNGIQVALSPVIFTSSTPTFLTSGYGGPVDSVKILGTNGFYIFDDLQYENPGVNPAAAPLPSAVWGGLALIGGLGMSRRTRAALA